MIPTNSSSAQLYLTTARIVGRQKDGTENSGTGFFFRFTMQGGQTVPCLITNKHVVDGAQELVFHVHEAAKINGDIGPGARSFEVRVGNPKSVVIEHPAGVDLCAIPVEPIQKSALEQEKAVFFHNLDESMLPTKETLENLLGMEEIAMVGYPIGLWDESNNLPLLRRGVTASHPAVDFNGSKVGVVDIACFPGSSGSPVLVFNEGLYLVGHQPQLGSRGILLGILYQGPIYQADGTIRIENIPTKVVAKSQTGIHIHIGYYITGQ
jgi:hypothetical protein